MERAKKGKKGREIKNEERERESRRGRDKRIAVSVSSPSLFPGFWHGGTGNEKRDIVSAGRGCVQPPYSGVAVTSLVKTP